MSSALDQQMRQMPAFKEWVPLRARAITLYLFILVFQFSGGLYGAAAAWMAGGTSLMADDLTMAACAMSVGVTMAFPVLFRLKFRLTTRSILPAVCVGLFAIGKGVGRRYADSVSGGQAMGQKNTILGIWLTVTYLNPTAAIAPCAYVVWQNLVNAWQLWCKEKYGRLKW